MHIYQRDRAGNVTQTTSAPIFINKMRDFRVKHITDFNWKDTFYYDGLLPKQLFNTGIGVSDMAVYKNNNDDGIKLGYASRFALDTVGFDEADNIKISSSFYVYDGSNYIEADLYVMDDETYMFKKINSSDFYIKSVNVTLDESYRDNNETISNSKYNTWYFDYYLPSKTLAVRKGHALDLMDNNTLKGDLLINFDITGNKNYGSSFDYTGKEDMWSKDNGSIYGTSLKSNINITGKGVNKGDIFYYDLQKNAIDDLKQYREW